MAFDFLEEAHEIIFEDCRNIFKKFLSNVKNIWEIGKFRTIFAKFFKLLWVKFLR